jgi:hypothetical protein
MHPLAQQLFIDSLVRKQSAGKRMDAVEFFGSKVPHFYNTLVDLHINDSFALGLAVIEMNRARLSTRTKNDDNGRGEKTRVPEAPH